MVRSISALALASVAIADWILARAASSWGLRKTKSDALLRLRPEALQSCSACFALISSSSKVRFAVVRFELSCANTAV